MKASTTLAILLLFICSINSLIINGSLIMSFTNHGPTGVDLIFQDIADLDNPNPISVVSIESDPGVAFNARMSIIALDRNTGRAFLAVRARPASDPNSRAFNVTLLLYRYLDNLGEFLPVPEEITRCRLGDVDAVSDAFVSSTGELYFVQRVNLAGPFLFRVSAEDCSVKNLGEIPRPNTASIQWLLTNDRLYYPVIGGMVEVNTADLSVKRIDYPFTNRRFGFGSYFTLDQTSGLVFIRLSDGNFGDQRSFRFNPITGNFTVTQDFDANRGHLGGETVNMFNVNNVPFILREFQGSMYASNSETFETNVWSRRMAGRFVTNFNEEWALHTLSTK